ncbi:MAG: hypothetical protein JO115_11085 [Pseudonocardiales bacterium]|nr:hypothetical protein [Pseudonocardiales bacterium]MBV9141442.1 hypothetical protein [Pseudonocardiales bacterium]
MSRRPSECEISYALLCQRLRGALENAVLVGHGADGIGSVPCQASAALYMLLMGHPVDRRGRCRSCRRSGAVLGFRRCRCRVYGETRFWLLQQPAEFLHSRLVCELGLTDRPPAQDSPTRTAARNRGDADVLPRVEPGTSDLGTEPSQTPTVPPSPPPQRRPWAGRSDPTHGEVGVYSDGPRPRRVPPDNPSTSRQPGTSLLLSAGMT